MHAYGHDNDQALEDSSQRPFNTSFKTLQQVNQMKFLEGGLVRPQ